MARKRAPKKKLEIVFDPEKRKEFLTGFRKRKNERKKKAKDQLDRSLKEERKRIRQEIKDGLKHMKKSHEPLKELTEQDKANEDEYEDDDVKVKIVELSANDLAAQNHLLGENRAAADESEAEESEDNDDEKLETNTNCIPGMDFDVSKARKRKKSKTDEQDGDDDEQPSKNGKIVNVKNKKEFDRLKKTKTLKQLKKSKVFKQKERIDKKLNQKKAQRDRNNTLKSLPKNQRKKKKVGEPSHYQKGRLLNRKQIRKMKQN